MFLSKFIIVANNLICFTEIEALIESPIKIVAILAQSLPEQVSSSCHRIYECLFIF